MRSQIKFKGEFSMTHMAHISVDTGMNGEMIVVVRPNCVSFATSLTSIPRYVIVLVSYVLLKPDLRNVRAIALRATETLVDVFNLDMGIQVVPR